MEYMVETKQLLTDIAACVKALSAGEISEGKAAEELAKLKDVCKTLEAQKVKDAQESGGMQNSDGAALSSLLYCSNRENLLKLTVVLKKTIFGFIPVSYSGNKDYLPSIEKPVKEHFYSIRNMKYLQFASKNSTTKFFTCYADAKGVEYIIGAVSTSPLSSFDKFKALADILCRKLKSGTQTPPIAIDYYAAVKEGLQNFISLGIASGIPMQASIFTVGSLANIFKYSGLHTLAMIADDTLLTLKRYLGEDALVAVITSEIYIAVLPERKSETKLSLVYDNILLKHIRKDFKIMSVDDMNEVWLEIEKRIVEDEN